MITGNDFIDLLYLPIDDIKIVAMRKELNVPKPLLDKNFKEDGGSSIVIDNYQIELFFEDPSVEDNTVNETYQKGIIIFGGMDFFFNTEIELPFNLNMGDSHDVILQKIGRTEDYDNDFLPQKIWRFTRDDGKNYLLYSYFGNDYTELLKLSLATYTTAVES